MAARISMLPLKTGSRAKGCTSAKQKSGKTSSLPAEMIQTRGVVKSFRKSMVASRTPRMIMQRGVDMVPRVLKLFCNRGGSQVFARRRCRMRPAMTERMVGLMMAAFREIYLRSPVRV